MIDIASETVITLAAGARLRPASRGGRPTHPGTLARWARDGLKGTKLEVIRIGGHLYTSVEALQRFADRLTGADATGSPSPYAARAAKDAERELIRRGI